MNIFLVEDERWALAELVELFKKYEPAHRVRAFGNGEDALHAAAADPPQLVLTDINMPGMDGLELIEELLGRYPDVKGIVLSVHEQFGYAQRGVKLGVIDYLLKPVKKDVLYKAIDLAILDIQNDSRKKDDSLNWSLLQQLITAQAPDRELAEPLRHQRCGMALLQIDKAASGFGDAQAAVLGTAAMKSLFRHPGLRELTLHCLTIDAKRKVFLAPAPDDDLAEAFRAGLSKVYGSLTRAGVQAHIGYCYKKEADSLNRCYEGLLKTFEEQIRFGLSTWIEPQGRSEKGAQADLASVWEKVRVLQTHLKQADMLKGSETIRKIGSELRTKAVTLKQLTLFVNDLFYSLKYNLQTSSRSEINLSKLQEDIHIVSELATYEQLTDWLVDKAFSLVGEHQPIEQNPKGLVPVLVKWIHANYQRDLSLQQFAADNHVSLGYLSRLFKSQTGFTFSDYVIRHRIAKARELLDEGDARLCDVSSLVGYEDAKHFSHLFKKIVGERPQAYAKRKKEKSPPRF